MNRKRFLGIGILALAMLAAGLYLVLQEGAGAGYSSVALKGYVGGEKVGLLEDKRVQTILKEKYKITLDYTRAGSLEMVSGNTQGVDFLWPSSQVALDIYKSRKGIPARDEIIFNSPIVLYAWDVAADALAQTGVVHRQEAGYYIVDLPQLLGLIREGKSWSQLGIAQLYGKVRVVSTDPTKSNSGSQFAGLLANILNQGNVPDDAEVEKLLPELKRIFASQGFMDSSSGDLFSQFLKQGVGAYPAVVGYENQIIEFSLENQQYLPMIKDKIRILYPEPTVWSNHPLIAVNDRAKRLIDALSDVEIQRMAWESHGFRTGLPGSRQDTQVLKLVGIPPTIDKVMPMPRASVMERIIAVLGQ